jgi:general secretion pathway protein G
MNQSGDGGFTLIEMAVVIAVIGFLASMALPFTEKTVQRAREAELRSALRQSREGLDAYKRAFDEGRIARSPTDSGYPKRLEQLVEGVEDVRRPDRARIHFLRRLPRDPFHPDPSAPAADTWGKRAYASPPEAPYEGEDVFDIYSRTERIGLNGIPYREW